MYIVQLELTLDFEFLRSFTINILPLIAGKSLIMQQYSPEPFHTQQTEQPFILLKLLAMSLFGSKTDEQLSGRHV